MRYLVTEKRALCQIPAHNISNLREQSQAYVTALKSLKEKVSVVESYFFPTYFLVSPSLKSMDTGPLGRALWHPGKEKMLPKAGCEERLAQIYPSQPNYSNL